MTGQSEADGEPGMSADVRDANRSDMTGGTGSGGGRIGESGDDPAAPPDEPVPLERKYRRLLRLLPKAYRVAREEEMVATFLESSYDADPDNADLAAIHGTPGWSETASVAALALRLRWTDPHAPERYRARAAALHTFTLAGLTVLTAWALMVVAGDIRLWIAPPSLLGDTPITELLFPTAAGWWAVVSRWAYVLWIPALLGAVRGTRRALAWAIAASGAVTVVSFASPIVTAAVNYRGLPRLDSLAPAVTEVLVELAVLAGLVARYSSARHRPLPVSRRWLIAAAAGFVAYELVWLALMAAFAWSATTPPMSVGYALTIVLDHPGMWCVASVAGVVVLWWRDRHGASPSAASWLGLAWFAAAATLLRLGTLGWWLPALGQQTPGSLAAPTALFAELVITLAIALGATVAANRLLGTAHRGITAEMCRSRPKFRP